MDSCRRCGTRLLCGEVCGACEPIEIQEKILESLERIEDLLATLIDRTPSPEDPE